jgi:hypothetical protein
MCRWLSKVALLIARENAVFLAAHWSSVTGPINAITKAAPPACVEARGPSIPSLVGIVLFLDHAVDLIGHLAPATVGAQDGPRRLLIFSGTSRILAPPSFSVVPR